MASSGKKKTTMAKLNRERKLRERRVDKQAKKDARKYAAAHPDEHLGDEHLGDAPTSADDQLMPPQEPDSPYAAVGPVGPNQG
jgi:hypothetical protein